MWWVSQCFTYVWMHGPMLRTIIWMILCAKENAFWVLLGVVCSSWVSINRGTSKRSILCPSGDERHQYVKDANNMVSRFPGYWVYIYIYLEGHSYECSGFDGISLWEDWCSLLIVFQYMTWYYIEASMCLYAEKSFLTYIVYIVWLFKHVSSTDAMWTLTWWAKINIFSPWMTLYRFTTANRFNHYNSCLQKNFNKPTLNMSQFLVSPMLGWVPWHLGLCINFMPLTVDGKYPAPIRGYTNM